MYLIYVEVEKSCVLYKYHWVDYEPSLQITVFP